MNNIPTSYPVEKNEEGELLSKLKVVEAFDKLKKNYTYFKENNLLDEIKKGGKYAVSFNKLLNETFYLSLEYVYENTVMIFGFYNKVFAKNMYEKAIGMVETVSPSIVEAVKAYDIDKLNKIADDLRSDFSIMYFAAIENDKQTFYATA